MFMEEEAKSKWCPLARFSEGGATCLGGKCMAWRLREDTERERRDVGCEVLLSDIRFVPCIRIVNAIKYNYMQEGLSLSALIADTKSGAFKLKPNVGKKSLAELRIYLGLMQELSLEPRKMTSDGYCGLAGKP